MLPFCLSVVYVSFKEMILPCLKSSVLWMKTRIFISCHTVTGIASSPGPFPLRQGLVLTACTCTKYFTSKNFVHCGYGRVTNQRYKAFFEIDSSGNSTCRILLSPSEIESREWIHWLLESSLQQKVNCKQPLLNFAHIVGKLPSVLQINVCR